MGKRKFQNTMLYVDILTEQLKEAEIRCETASDRLEVDMLREKLEQYQRRLGKPRV